MDDKRFWSMIEDAWADVDGAAASRTRLVRGKLDEDAAMELAEQSLTEFVPALRSVGPRQRSRGPALALLQRSRSVRRVRQVDFQTRV